MSKPKSEYLQKLGAKIKEYRQIRGLSQSDLADMLGYSSRSAINRIETGASDISRDKFALLAQVLDISPVELMDVDGAIKNNATATSIPVYDFIVDGIPVELNNTVSAYEDIPQRLTANADYFAYRIQDKTMEPMICLDDILIVRAQLTAEDGDLILVSIDSQKAQCKKYNYLNDCHLFISYNGSIPPIVIPDSASDRFNIIGQVIELRRKFA